MAEDEATSGVIYKSISASGYARQQNGNITNHYTRHTYQMRRYRSDDTLRLDKRNAALLTAAAEGQTTRIRHLLDLGVDIDHSDSHGFTALHHAALSGFEDTVEVGLEAGADVNATSLDCGTAIHLAALKSRAHVVELLMKYRANVNKVSRLMGSVVHCASYAGNEDILRILGTSKAELDTVAVVLPSLLRSVSREGDYCPQLPHRQDDHELPEPAAESSLATNFSGVLECLPRHLAILQGNHEILETDFFPPSLTHWQAWYPVSLDDGELRSGRPYIETAISASSLAADPPSSSPPRSRTSEIPWNNGQENHHSTQTATEFLPDIGSIWGPTPLDDNDWDSMATSVGNDTEDWCEIPKRSASVTSPCVRGRKSDTCLQTSRRVNSRRTLVEVESQLPASTDKVSEIPSQAQYHMPGASEDGPLSRTRHPACNPASTSESSEKEVRLLIEQWALETSKAVYSGVWETNERVFETRLEGFYLEKAAPRVGENPSWARVGRRAMPFTNRKLAEISRKFRALTNVGPAKAFAALNSSQQAVVSRLVAEYQYSEKDKDAEWVLEYLKPTIEKDYINRVKRCMKIAVIIRRQARTLEDIAAPLSAGEIGDLENPPRN